MQNKTKITVYTQTYNAGGYLRQCIDSVLNQTYTDFEYIIVDHGSVDGTYDVIKEYSLKDSRIRTYRYENSIKWLITILRKEFKGDYYTVLDQDDWIESDYLERLLYLAEKNNADIVNTGSVFFNEREPEIKKVILPNVLDIDKRQYDIYLPIYHWYYRQYWGKLIRTELLKNADFPDWSELGFAYGIDTYTSFNLLSRSQRICIDNSALHHYQIHTRSMSYKYTESRAYSSCYLYNFLVGFLSQYGEVSKENQLFLYLVYLSSIEDALKVLFKSDIAINEKMNEAAAILSWDVTMKSLSYAADNSEDSFYSMFIEGFDYMAELRPTASGVAEGLFGYIFNNWNESICDFSEIERIFVSYWGDLSRIVDRNSITFWAESDQLRKKLIAKNVPELICGIAELIRQKKYIKKYDLDSMIRLLAGNDRILSLITDKMFIRHYYDIYISVAKKNYPAALDMMTAVIKDNKKTTGTFLNFYLVLAALLEKADEFVAGKFCIAEYYFQHKCYDECRAAVNDLEDMGFGADERLIGIKEALSAVEE